ncbi:hypothetical protein [Microterricola viridarii]|uniref:DUF1269 domain-containing protein n=1 Tax=Microterricola viridarii TaxID=412690 RepID=A0A1H1V032_9MICO|nr:hypothetical protein [Microterricola viridarii]SDS78137.1 hypothetical protein SAMN04489834_2137 [Microterricola viridarii]
MATEEFSGPVAFLVFAGEDGADFGPGLSAVLERVQQGIIEVLDIELVALGVDGAPVKRAIAELTGTTGLDLSVFDGAESGILDAEDLAAVAADLADGQLAIVIVYEDRSLAAAAAVWASAGVTEMLAGGVDIADLEHALEEGSHS